MNRKNPGFVEPEQLSQDEKRQYSLCYAVGWTIAAIVYTLYSLWQGVGHHLGGLGLGWLLAALGWGYWWHKRRNAARLKP